MALFEKSIPLDPGRGGRCVTSDALQPADIIVSTARGAASVSTAIRVLQKSVVSHAALYSGDKKVIEAVGEGVLERPLAIALSDDVLAVVYRDPRVTNPAAIVNFARKQVARQAKYSAGGAVAAGASEFDSREIQSIGIVACRVIGTSSSSFFCSQLVAEAYKDAGFPLFKRQSSCVTPKDLADYAAVNLQYVGHLLGSLSRFPVLFQG